MSTPDSNYVVALTALRRADVRFVVVGVGGINFYAREPGDVISTADMDTVLHPSVDNLKRALAALSGAGFSFESGDEPFVDIEDEAVLTRIIEVGATIVVRLGDVGQLDLMTSITGTTFDDLVEDAARFEFGGTEIRVGRLSKLLRSKELSARPKDKEFLRAYAARLEEHEIDEEP